jgi:hypothetical protein
VYRAVAGSADGASGVFRTVLLANNVTQLGGRDQGGVVRTTPSVSISYLLYMYTAAACYARLCVHVNTTVVYPRQ